MNNDTELLRIYVEEHSENAFAELVRQHLNLVYSAALRESAGNTGFAEDIAQAVFTKLAGKARHLLKHPSLAGWLYTTVRFLAANMRRSDQRRRNREEKARIMNEILSDESPDSTWQQIHPVIDDILHELNETDRTVVVLRFLEDRSLRDVGASMGINENTARMRIDRVLDRLQVLMKKRGITSTASGLAAALAIGVVTPPPAALASSIAATALASSSVVVSSASNTFTLLKIMSMTKIRATVIGALVLTGVAVPVWQQTRLSQANSENARLQAQVAELNPLRDKVVQSRQIESDKAELERLRNEQANNKSELLRLRGMAGVARRVESEAAALRTQLALQQNQSNQISGSMDELMNNAREQQVKVRLSRMKESLKLSSEQTDAIREILMRQSRATSAGVKQVSSGKFDKEELRKFRTEVGNVEEQIKSLLTPQQLEGYSTYQQEEAMYSARLSANSELVQMQSSLDLTQEQQDRAYAILYECNFNLMNSKSVQSFTNPADEMQWFVDQKTEALKTVLTTNQMESYRQQQNAQLQVMKDITSKMQKDP
jgi:RNA polymerase sigma factor (sigma-70 family)